MGKHGDTDNKNKLNIKKWAIGLIGGVIALVVIYGSVILFVTWPISEVTVDKSGVFGDSFGLLTSLFSGLAFSGLILTLFLQREELSLQRKEIKDTREEMKFQNFETTFFQMLRLHNSILESIDLRGGNDNTPIATGRDCFRNFHNNLVSALKNNKSYLDEHGLEGIQKIYNKFFWSKRKQDLGHYFRYLYRIFKYVDESYVTKKQKKLYSSIVRAQLSDMETSLLFYNCLSTNGYEKFKPYVEKYTLLDNMPLELLADQKHKDLYDPSAFAKEK